MAEQARQATPGADSSDAQAGATPQVPPGAAPGPGRAEQLRSFSVWAPSAGSVEILVGSERSPMEAAGGGWWSAEVEAGEGVLYGFSLDGGPVRPDPRSQSQPSGVHGLSEVVEHSSHRWSDGSWRGVHLPGAVLYELHVGTFTEEGTFDAAAAKLSHLVELGVDAVELLPLAEFAGERGWGYDGVDLYAPHHAYGGPAGLKRFVEACHRAGIGVVIDVVYNHLGPAGNYLGEFGPYFSERHRTNWGAGVNLDGPGSDEVRRYFVDNAIMWLRDYHADGLRLDAVHALADDSALPFLEQLAEEVAALAAHLRKPLFLVAENDRNDPRPLRSRDAGGFGLDAAWADEWHHALHAVLTGERAGYYEDFGDLGLLSKALRQAWVYDGCYSPHRKRRHGRSPAGLGGQRFVVFTQNHDQVGNRARGERLSALCSRGRLKVAAALLLCSPFVPMLFQGEEWGASTPWQYFTDFEDPQLGKAVTEGRRREFSAFGWRPEEVPDPQDPATFERSKLDWSELAEAGHTEVLAWYKALIELRRRRPELSCGPIEEVAVRIDEAARGVVLWRGRVAVVANLGASGWTADLGGGASLLAGSEEAVAVSGQSVSLPPDSAAVVEVEVEVYGRGPRQH